MATRDSTSSPNAPVARWLTGCVLVPVALMTAFLVMGVGLVAFAIVVDGERGPFEKPPLAIMSVAILGLLAGFFAVVTRRLVASLRGKEVPHLFPPVVGLVAGGLMGIASIVTGIAFIFGAKVGSGAANGIGIGLLFLGYAGQCARRMIRARAG